MTRQRFPWSPEEDRIIRSLFPVNATHKVAALIDRTTSAVFQRARILGVKKCQEYLATRAHRLNGSEPASRANRFKPGQAPHNKGRPQDEWMPAESRKRVRRTQFKPGRPPQEARNYRTIGSLRIRHDGCLERKVTDDHPVPARRWVAEHRLVWEAAHGPVPKGHLVVFKPGKNTTDPDRITLDRLELITRAENMRRNSYLTRYPKDVADLIRTRGHLNRKINQEIQREKQSL